MAKQTIVTTGTPTTLPAGAAMINANFTELYDGSHIVAATAKTTPVDGDCVGLQDSAASNARKKLTWGNIKATLKTYFDTLYALGSTQGPYGVLYVDNERGNDSTGNGTFGKPFATIAVAVTAGSALDDFIIDLAYGSYTWTLTAAQPSGLKGFRGTGLQTTSLTITAAGVGAGDAGFDLSLGLVDLRADVFAGGAGNDEFSPGGNGGNLTLHGRFSFQVLTTEGGGGVTQGNGGNMVVSGAISIGSASINTAGTSPGLGEFDDSYLISMSFTGALACSRCSLDAANIGSVTDRGGNANW